MIEQILGIKSDYIILALLVLSLVMLIMIIVVMMKQSKLNKKYEYFMKGSNGKSLEDTLFYRLEQVDELIEENAANERNIEYILATMRGCYQKIGIQKYDAFNEMGGKLSFALCLLNSHNNGFIINAMHTRDGCYTYTKEIIDGNSVISLSDEEDIALRMALGLD